MTDSRAKGARDEAALCAWLQPIFPAAHRTRTPGHQADRGDIGGIPGWTVEAKNAKAWRMAEWWAQTCEAAARNESRPLLTVKRPGTTDQGERLAVVRLSDWAELVAAQAAPERSE